MGRWIGGPHTAMLGKTDLIEWLCIQLHGADSIAQSPRAIRAPVSVFASYKGHPAYSAWFDCYQSAIDSFRDEAPVARIVDMTTALGRPPAADDAPIAAGATALLQSHGAESEPALDSATKDRFGLHVRVIPMELIGEADVLKVILTAFGSIWSNCVWTLLASRRLERVMTT